MNRYSRQISLKDFGVVAQDRLFQAKVLVVGAGGLGCPALLYLAGAGIGTLGIVDGDSVSLTNLHRQVLYGIDDIGSNKARVAASKLNALNPEIDINLYPEMLNAENAIAIVEQYDIIVDGTDNFSSRYLINDACVLLGKPLIYGAVSQYEGQVAVFNVSDNENAGTHYRDLFPKSPEAGEIRNCEEAGVLGVLPGVIGTMQAAEVIKLIAGIGKPLVNQLLTYNILTQETYVLSLAKHPGADKIIPADVAAFRSQHYQASCTTQVQEIDLVQFGQLKSSAVIIDVREFGEQPELDSFVHLRIPLSSFQNGLKEINSDTVVFLCQSGARSKKAAEIYSRSASATQTVYSLKGGILSLIS